MIDDLFRVLEMEKTADWKVVQRRVRHLLRQYHPDVHQDNKLYYEEKTKKILRAYQMLRQHFNKEATLPNMPKPQPPVSLPLSFLAFRISHKQFAFPVETVLQVVEGRQFKDHSSFLGRVKARGGEMPVFSLANLLHIYPSQQPLSDTFQAYLNKVIIISEKNRKAGFFVHQVDGLIEMTEQDFVSKPNIPSLQKYLQGVAVKEERIIFILSAEKIFQVLS